MASHQKPTKDELQAQIDAAAAAADAEETPTDTPTEETETADATIDETETQEDNDPGDEEQAEGEQETSKKKQTESSQEEDEPTVDYRRKFVESTRESQVLHSKNKKLTESIDKAMSITDVDEADLRKEYPEYDDMTETEKRLAKDNLINRKRLETIHSTTQEFKQVDEWVGKVDEFVTDPKTLNRYEDLEGREDEFRLFALKPSRRGVDMDDLVAAFLHTAKPARKHTGSLLETGTGGPKSKPSDKISLAEADRLRRTDYKKYNELLRTGKIDVNV